jgi:predicted ABC-type ATPase
VNRVRNRVKQGGHNIPTHVIKRRFFAGRENFNKIYKDLVDQWVLFDNTGEIPIILDRKGDKNA